MKTKTKSTRKRQPRKTTARKPDSINRKSMECFAEGGANFYFTTQEINAIKNAVKDSAMIEAECLGETDIAKTPALRRLLENEVRVLESVLDKLNFND